MSKTRCLDRFFILEGRLQRWIEDNVVQWSFVLITIGTLLALFQSYLLGSDSKSTIITIMLYGPFLLAVEYSVRIYN